MNIHYFDEEYVENSLVRVVWSYPAHYDSGCRGYNLLYNVRILFRPYDQNSVRQFIEL